MFVHDMYILTLYCNINLRDIYHLFLQPSFNYSCMVSWTVGKILSVAVPQFDTIFVTVMGRVLCLIDVFCFGSLVLW